MAHRHQNNVKELVRIIEEDIKSNQDEIKNLNQLILDVNQNNGELQKENDMMKSTIIQKKEIFRELKEQENDVEHTLRDNVRTM